MLLSPLSTCHSAQRFTVNDTARTASLPGRTEAPRRNFLTQAAKKASVFPFPGHPLAPQLLRNDAGEPLPTFSFASQPLFSCTNQTSSTTLLGITTTSVRDVQCIRDFLFLPFFIYSYLLVSPIVASFALETSFPWISGALASGISNQSPRHPRLWREPNKSVLRD
ncbi:hypothetical protein HDV62DRAFT_273909 [Trichoderma sp. SZMC 28011]